jgi:hypothetical protein
MPPPDVLMILEQQDGVFLYGYTLTRQPAGDTWHRTIEEAKEQARFAHGDAISWRVIPESVTDPLEFAVSESASSN